MQLANKKTLAAKTLGVGEGRIIFSPEHLAEIAEAITRQDMIDLNKAGAIKIREINGRRTAVKRKHRRGTGKRKKIVNKSKQDYVKLTRKLRVHVGALLRLKKISKEKSDKIRHMIKASRFKSKRHLNEIMEEI